MPTPDAELEQMIERVRQARADRTPLEIRGGGSKSFYGGVPRGVPLEVTSLAGISSYEPSELVVTVRAGTSLAELETALREHGQCLAFEPPRFSAAGTVGGMVAAGLSGPSRANVGSVRDHVLGVTVISGRGELLTFGGQVAKNVAGYDVSRLMVGSLGVLGLICEVSLKVLPISAASKTLCFEYDESRSLQQLSRWSSQPLPISASSWHEDRLHVRLSGARAAVNAACNKLAGTEIEPGAAASWWCSLRDHTETFFRLAPAALSDGECLWRVSVPATTPVLDLPGRQFVEWNGAQRWWRTAAPAKLMRAAAASAGGHATLLRGADKSAGTFAPLSNVLMGIHRGLKRAFDPDGIFNPGRLYSEL